MSSLKVVKSAQWICRTCRGRGTQLRPQARWQSIISGANASSPLARQWSTPLAKTIGEAIQTTGPISIAQYMRLCLTSPEGGYYTRQTKDGDQFGQKGDFITSPEISQVFGELLGLWFLTEWMAQGRRKSGIELIEVGPGRGTLMDDMLRAIRNFKAFASGIESVYLIEASPSLREKQKQLLCGDAPLQETDTGWRCRSKYEDISITWYEDIRLVPAFPEKTPFIVAHEFFDALPIHAFKAVPPSPDKPNTITGLDGKPIELKSPQTSASKTHQWRELVVSLTPPKTQFCAKNPNLPINVSRDEHLDFTLSQAHASNPASLVIPEASERYRKLRGVTDALIEISPESHTYVGEFARRIGGPNAGSAEAALASRQGSIPPSPPSPPRLQASGAALILDYGTLESVPTSTLRGIRQHQLVSPFSAPGHTDLSADVDFTALAEAAIDASPSIEVHGPVEQAAFLEAMGIHERARALEARAAKADDARGVEAAKRVASAVERLVERGGGGMGRIYKALAIVPENGGRRRPVGFGGQVTPVANGQLQTGKTWVTVREKPQAGISTQERKT